MEKKEFFVKNDEQRQKLIDFFQKKDGAIKINLDSIVGGEWYDVLKSPWPESTWTDIIKPISWPK